MNQTKKSFFVRIVSFALTACLALGIVTVAAGAEEKSQKEYVALGDSISTGYGLAENEKSFAEIIAEEHSYNLTNLAEDGATTASLLESIKQPAAAAAISAADIITITIGGNDFVNAFYAYVANKYNEANPDDTKTPEDIKNLILANNFMILNFALNIASDFSSSDEAQAAIAQVQTNLPAAISYIKYINPTAEIILTNQYNPYSFAAGTLVGTDSYTLMFKALEAELDSGIQKINSLATILCTQLGCSVADTYTAFKGADQNPTNAVFSLMGLSLDFHPNAYGHSLIANTVSNLIADEPEYTLGDVNMDGIIDVNDVSMIQMYVANMELGDSFNASLADLDDNGEISITDATLLQIFIAQIN